MAFFQWNLIFYFAKFRSYMIYTYTYFIQCFLVFYRIRLWKNGIFYNNQTNVFWLLIWHSKVLFYRVINSTNPNSSSLNLKLGLFPDCIKITLELESECKLNATICFSISTAHYISNSFNNFCYEIFICAIFLTLILIIFELHRTLTCNLSDCCEKLTNRGF